MEATIATDGATSPNPRTATRAAATSGSRSRWRRGAGLGGSSDGIGLPDARGAGPHDHRGPPVAPDDDDHGDEAGDEQAQVLGVAVADGGERGQNRPDQRD